MPKGKIRLKTVIVTPELAAELLEKNKLNRPLNQPHVIRIAGQITSGKWKFNGDTIKIAHGDDVLDGQHRLWAVVEAQMPVETVVVYGIDPEAFDTIDTLRKVRTFSDVVALGGQIRHRGHIAAALGWLLRWQRGVLPEYKQPQNRVENSDITAALKENPGIVACCERATTMRGLANRGLMTFLFYIVANRNEELAKRMMDTLDDPSGVPTTDPFYQLRSFFARKEHGSKDPIEITALAIKAINSAHKGERIKALSWKSHGPAAEPFPKLKV